MKKGIGLKIFLSCFMTILLITFLVFGISCSNKQATNFATTPATTSSGVSTVQTGTTATFGNAAETTQAAGQGSALKEEILCAGRGLRRRLHDERAALPGHLLQFERALRAQLLLP